MRIDPADFRRNFELLSDATLLGTRREDLIPVAQQCYDEEVARRGLKSANAPLPAAPTSTASEEDVTITDETPVTIATYSIAEEASLARGLLESAGVPCSLASENLGLGGFQLRLIVPASYEEAALEVLESEITDEELAAQAEAAGILEIEEVYEFEEEAESEPED